MKTGDILSGEIIDFSHEGNGVMKIQSFTVFASGGIIGDKVKVRINEVKKNYALASVIEIIEHSNDRVKFDFFVEESRAGIPLIEYNYNKQLEWKRNKVEMDLQKIASLQDVKVNETIGMDHPFRYRNHVQIPVGERDDNIVIGFYEQGTNHIIDMDTSILQPEVGDRIINIVRMWMKGHNIRPYNRKNKEGILRHIGIRVNKENEVMVILVSGSKKIPFVDKLICALQKENVVSIYQNINSVDSSIIYGREYIRLYGMDKLGDYIGKLEFQLSPNSFFQTNRKQTEVLYNKAIEYLELNKDDIVYDLFSGIGTISLFMAPYVKKVYGVEIVKKAIEDAWENAKLNNLHNVEFILGKTEDILQKFASEKKLGNKIILDPPRKGCVRKSLETIVKISPERIVYVSCNPSTMARDVKYLVDKGYEVVEVQPVDMFPHTGHVECIALIQREII